LCAVVAAATLVSTVHALDPDRTMPQYIRDRWESDKGFPGGAVHAITQTSDGYLWIAAEKGLVRFDGLKFRFLQPAGLTSARDSAVLGVAKDVNGSLWAELRNTMLQRYRNDVFEDLPSALAAIRPAVTAMSVGNGGTLFLAVVDHGIVAYRPSGIETIVPQRALSNSVVIAIAQTSDGEVWLGTRDAGLIRVHEGQLTPITTGLSDLKINALLPGGGSEMWIGTAKGIARWDGAALTHADLPKSLENIEALAMAMDRDSNIWIGTASGELLRVNGHGVASLDERDRDGRGAVTAVFEDRDGNLWIGTTQGVERLRDGTFTTYSSGQGLPSGTYGSVYADGDRTWFAPVDGGLYWLRDGLVGAVKVAGVDRDVVYSISGGAGDLWLGRQHGGLTRLSRQGDGYTARTFTRADGLAQDTVYAVHRAKDGSVWAGTLSAGVSRLTDGTFTTFTTATGLASNTMAAILEASDGTIWLATPNGVNARSAGGWRRYTASDGLPSNDVNTLFQDSTANIWIGTAAGLAVFRNGGVQAGFAPPQPLRASIFGIAEDRAGWLWISTIDHVFRVNRERLVRGSVSADELRGYGVSDGLLGIEGVKRQRSIVTDAKGRIWLSLSRGLSMVDPARSTERAVPPLPHVEEMLADGISMNPAAAITIPPRPQRITLTFTGLSLATPERVLFRYRLDGFDHDWSEPVAVRQAVYTNLVPGPYQFHLVASNSDGVWNGSETVVRFAIAPAIWQTAWFRIFGIVLVTSALWVGYRVRMRQLAAALNRRLEERVAERTRIAQELHDTLLQGVVSASMQLHVASSRLPKESPAATSLTRVSELMRQIIDEARIAVRGLRSGSANSDDLETVFLKISDEFGTDNTIAYRVVVEGKHRVLQPIVREEVYRIGREAVVNAFRHSAGTVIDLELRYASAGLRVIVRDNGRGIDSQLLKTGRDGHWGLTGMRERAERIGARVKIWSAIGRGTEVELWVPASLAFIKEHGS
jgi:signal transduction histidine kinase/ligand-binding sensor domain-containing protein